MFEDIYSCHSWERGCYGYLAGRSQGCCSAAYNVQESSHNKKNYLDLNDNRVKAEKPCPSRDDSPPGTWTFNLTWSRIMATESTESASGFLRERVQRFTDSTTWVPGACVLRTQDQMTAIGSVHGQHSRGQSPRIVQEEDREAGVPTCSGLGAVVGR